MPFTFKNRPSEKVAAEAIAPSTSVETSPLQKCDLVCDASVMKITGLKGIEQRVDPPVEETNVNIESVDDSRLILPFPSKAVSIVACWNSTIVMFPTQTSVFIRNCSSLKLVAAAQQIRIHDCRDVTLYVHFNSAIIIENTTGIKLAPYRLSVSGNNQPDGQLADYLTNTNDVRSKYATIMDFDYVTGQSPNWSLLDSNEFEDFIV